MKKKIRLYISFTRSERIGIAALCSVLVILIGIRATMFLWMHPVIDGEKEKKLAALWETVKEDQHGTVSDTLTKEKNDYEDAFDDNETPLPQIININNADSATLVRLKGIGPVTASKIIARRKNIGPFTDVDQLLEITHMPKSTFEILRKHLCTADKSK